MQLERFLRAKAEEVKALHRTAERGEMPPPYPGHRPAFTEALWTSPGRGLPAVIAEYKRASPSRGVICEDLSVEETARQYADAGAAALSILTEERFFNGRLEFLERAAEASLYNGPRPPLLRKDFIFDPLQVRATASTPASALLLIVRLTPDAHLLRRLREDTEAHGMQVVVEVFDAIDLRLARESGARVIQVNARDLDSLTVDRSACLDLAKAYPPEADETWIAASGMQRQEHLLAAANAGFRAVLVGSALMEGGRPGAALTSLLGSLPARVRNCSSGIGERS